MLAGIAAKAEDSLVEGNRAVPNLVARLVAKLATRRTGMVREQTVNPERAASKAGMDKEAGAAASPVAGNSCPLA